MGRGKGSDELVRQKKTPMSLLQLLPVVACAQKYKQLCTLTGIFRPHGKPWLEVMVTEIHEHPTAEFSTAEISLSSLSPTKDILL